MFSFDGDLRDVLSRFLEAAGIVGVMSPGVKGSVLVATPLPELGVNLEIGASLARDVEKYFSRAAAGFDAGVVFDLWVGKFQDYDPVGVFRLMLWGAVEVCEAFGGDCVLIHGEVVVFCILGGEVVFNFDAGVVDEERLRGFSRVCSVRRFPVL